MMRNFLLASAGAILLSLSGPQVANTATLEAWAPVPVKPAPFTGPNKPHKKFTDILARIRLRP